MSLRTRAFRSGGASASRASSGPISNGPILPATAPEIRADPALDAVFAEADAHPPPPLVIPIPEIDLEGDDADGAPAPAWFAARNHEASGPMTIDELLDQWNSNELSADSLVWRP